MKRFARLFLSTSMSIAVLAGASISLTGCSADTLSGPSIEAYTEGGGGNGAGGSEHNELTGGGNGAGGSEHNEKAGGGNGAGGSEHNELYKTGGGNGAGGSEHNEG